MKRAFLHALYLFLSVASASADAMDPSYSLGVEASGDAFVDLAKQSYRWEKAVGAKQWAPLERADVDEHGWPKSDCHWVFDSRPCAEWTGHIDDPEAYRIDRSGTYHGSFLGQAKLSVSGGGTLSVGHQSYDSKENRTTFELNVPRPGPNHGLIILEFRETKRTADSPANSGISQFSLIRPGYPVNSHQLFTNDYLHCLKSARFTTIRFMAVTNTNGNVEWGKDHTKLQSWSNRKLPDDASVEAMPSLNKKDGWPWEYVIELCNEASTNLWINIPVSADTDYIRQLSLLLKAKLHPNTDIYLEDSNEIWNFGFLQYAWNKARAKEEVAEKLASYNDDQVNNEEIWAQRRHAQRVKDIVDIFREGPQKINNNTRSWGMLAGVTPDPNGFFICGRLSGMLEYLQKHDGDPKGYIYSISIPIYYGGKAAVGEKGTENASVADILDGMKQSIEASKKDRTAMVELAKKYELLGGFSAYEGGPDIGGGRTANIANRIKAIRDPAQAKLYKKNFNEAFWFLGGNLAMQFTLAGPYSRYGAWGLTDDVAKRDRNSLFKAAAAPTVDDDP